MKKEYKTRKGGSYEKEPAKAGFLSSDEKDQKKKTKKTKPDEVKADA